MGDHEHLDMSIGLGLSSNEHVALTGLAFSRRSAKDLMLRYDEVLSERLQQEELEPTDSAAHAPDVPADGDERRESDGSPAGGQTTLF